MEGKILKFKYDSRESGNLIGQKLIKKEVKMKYVLTLLLFYSGLSLASYSPLDLEEYQTLGGLIQLSNEEFDGDMKRAFESLLEGGEQAALEVPEGYVAVLLEDGSAFLVPIEALLAFVHEPELEDHDIKVHSGSFSEKQLPMWLSLWQGGGGAWQYKQNPLDVPQGRAVNYTD